MRLPFVFNQHLSALIDNDIAQSFKGARQAQQLF
jgi:hypothetical protein